MPPSFPSSARSESNMEAGIFTKLYILTYATVKNEFTSELM